jgi:hypothetical protein
LNKLRFDPAPEVQRAADAALAEIELWKTAIGKITDMSAKALETQAFDTHDQRLRKLAREKLRLIHPKLEEYAWRLGEYLLDEKEPGKHAAAIDSLEPIGGHAEASAHLILHYLRAHKEWLQKNPSLDGRVQIYGACSRALLRLAPRAEVTREFLLAVNDETAKAFRANTLCEEHPLWFGGELVANFPNDPEVTRTIKNAAELVVGVEIDNPRSVKVESLVLYSLGKLAAAREDQREDAAKLLEKFVIRHDSYLAMAEMGQVVVVETLTACGDAAIPIIDKAKETGNYKVGNDFIFCKCIDAAAAKLRKAGPKTAP